MQARHRLVGGVQLSSAAGTENDLHSPTCPQRRTFPAFRPPEVSLPPSTHSIFEATQAPNATFPLSQSSDPNFQPHRVCVTGHRDKATENRAWSRKSNHYCKPHFDRTLQLARASQRGEKKKKGRQLSYNMIQIPRGSRVIPANDSRYSKATAASKLPITDSGNLDEMVLTLSFDTLRAARGDPRGTVITQASRNPPLQIGSLAGLSRDGGGTTGPCLRAVIQCVSQFCWTTE
ncbi:hypothetical protein BJY01DRAFT_24726 [Aspergillus pseudoustus]|uniref:Uncharacterized protein n=1 Tax=Aspergillus pseudoustus TaxID=1810923 RepID=A0ABR4JIP3_9EURO